MSFTKKDAWQTAAGLGATALLAVLFIFIYPFSHAAAWILFILVFVAVVELSYAPLRTLVTWLVKQWGKLFPKK